MSTEIRAVNSKTSVQITPTTRDRLYRLKFRRTYDQFLNELCDLYKRRKARQRKSRNGS